MSSEPISAPPNDVSVDPKGDRSLDIRPTLPDPDRQPLLPRPDDGTRDSDRRDHDQARTPSDRKR